MKKQKDPLVPISRKRKRQEKIENLLKKFCIDLPGYCEYDHPVKEIPDIINQDVMPESCNRYESARCIHYYNYKKHQLFEAIKANKSLKSIVDRINELNDIKWKIVQINLSLAYNMIERRSSQRNVERDSINIYNGMYRAIDTFDHSRKLSPSTYLCNSIGFSLMHKGSANYRNMNMTIASEMGKREDRSNGASEIFESEVEKRKRRDRWSSRETLNEYEINEYIHTRIKSIKNKKHRKALVLKYFKHKTLKEIGEIMGISRARVGQMIDLAINDMRIKENQALYRFDGENRLPLLPSRRRK